MSDYKLGVSQIMNGSIPDYKLFRSNISSWFYTARKMNKWAEGDHLEPCVKYGTAYFQAAKKH